MTDIREMFGTSKNTITINTKTTLYQYFNKEHIEEMWDVKFTDGKWEAFVEHYEQTFGEWVSFQMTEAICDLQGGLDWFIEKEEECNACEGKCRSEELEKCEDCGIELRIGCENKPSHHSIFNGCCDNCREEDEDEERQECVGGGDAKCAGKNWYKPSELDLGMCKACYNYMEEEANAEYCAICDKRLGMWKERGKNKYEMKCIIDNMLEEGFESYVCCGLCALDRIKQKTYEKKRNKEDTKNIQWCTRCRSQHEMPECEFVALPQSEGGHQPDWMYEKSEEEANPKSILEQEEEILNKIVIRKEDILALFGDG